MSQLSQLREGCGVRCAATGAAASGSATAAASATTGVMMSGRVLPDAFRAPLATESLVYIRNRLI
jgi:hypothetical protein